MPTVAFHTLGCKVNHYETEALWQLFKQAGYEKIDFEQSADVYVINTCTVTNTGDKKSRQVIRRAIRRNPEAVVAVTGCYAQTTPHEIMAIPGVDIVVGTSGRDNLIDYVNRYLREREPINAVSNIMKAREYEELDVPEFTDRTRASLKIQEGCNNFCTFCIIPWARGLMRSRKPESVIEQANKLVAAGYKEIVLTGIHTGGYGEDLEDYNLARLLRELDTKVPGLKRIRISSIEASQITDEVIEVLNSSDKMCRHLHVPLQAGDDNVLKRMRRKYTTDEFRRKIEQLHQALPDVAITTDIIVGFPGETEEMYENGYRFIEEMKFAELHVFPYSKRSGTPAARMEDQVDEEVKNRRVHELIALSDKLALEYSGKFVGDVLEVIPEEPYKEAPDSGLYVGHSDNYLKLVFEANESLVGKICKVRLDEPGSEYCKGTFARVLSEETLKA
ncbi:tRNA (N(6)-L-threonylcarbamoyladenosine(37)-C(2))-methylthiotransferase MtaB [Aneurinibacillus aneurinilyticus]|jgi:threonylcarbamoyladenosine tRNA methylthiotransferase MtaB|uniref:Threonylcarbamoyladenosine tRNA methylthiotransferase MtaB n=2 Tax=Aneurinibacillus aneurinilyticus TaxID=1391 RepID=A0A848CZ48_ANEAE|nr:tRNA (N(6)-L-threonylcarbamoyladenosine(37)-C(2))-methylthiotransferase MtaB [Aneurinibacillus aneurinilyticus]ERI07989.1 tRNA methylthiotransferase YqeV [Aneurinibacillus aneurinilyticus ATCC 12856]MCI1694369.1 tRNA (N(6)-L-threonylcarbamoyladenosine(37)-C(2))-methylthiotransferase MtaB [Aneurinibacillus aneurinilyticus]MED0705377.1 tRNA (N(6)-L-threonylcarbamoyladenosine(37)-C(2))-methylthiotransferase MtaB [Aneurinibacillus aneurinilyticus]MED0725004.1 tRNA (N(6)-L-threonylcarbamoyladenos